MEWKSLNVVEDSSCSGVFLLIVNRPSHRNALDGNFFREFPQALASLDANPSARVIVLMGSGKHFCAGIDLSVLGSHLGGSQIPDAAGNHKDDDDQGRVKEKIRREIKQMQAAITALEECRKPVIAAIDGGCIGAGVDIISACDIRYCTEDAFFSLKEVDLAVIADGGSLQRLPRLVGAGNAMELALTGRRFDGFEAKRMGLIQTVFPTKAAMEEHVSSIAKDIAGKSPHAVSGTKAVLLKSRDLSLEQGLDYVATWNTGMLLSTDLKEALSAQIQKRKPLFAKLGFKTHDIKKAVVQNSKRRGLWNDNRGNECFKQQKYPEAVKHCTEAIKRNPNDLRVYSNRAACYTELGALREGLKDANKCIELDPAFTKGYSRKGAVQFFMKEYDKALETYQEGLKHNENNQELIEGV